MPQTIMCVCLNVLSTSMEKGTEEYRSTPHWYSAGVKVQKPLTLCLRDEVVRREWEIMNIFFINP